MNLKLKTLIKDTLFGILAGALIALFIFYGLTMDAHGKGSKQGLLEYIEETAESYGICLELEPLSGGVPG